jgi:hypothetical protein
MVFGVSVPAAARPVQIAQATPAAAASAYAAAPMAPASASVTPQTPIQPARAVPASLPPIGPATADAVANSVPPGGGPATLSPLPARGGFAAPARRTQVTPNALPMPTTGPAAVPGHFTQTQAVPAMTQGDANWFAQAVNNGLDKYAAAQKLADQNVTANAGAAASAQASAQTFATVH